MAELELFVGNSKRGKPDGVQLLELLQKLVATIPRTDKVVLKQHQRQCEAMLYDVLAHGIGAAVRRLIYSCFSALYSHGDPISIYTRVNTLQSYLASKEGMSRSTAESIRVGLLDFLAHLSLHYGRMLANAAPESMAIASRTVGKSGNQAPVRCAALRLATAVVRGLNPTDRSAPGVHSDGWAVVHRHAKDRTCDDVRSGCMALLSALCMAGAGPLWRDGAYATEEALRMCLALSDDPVQSVHDAAFRALGELAAASRGSAAAEAVTAEKRPAKKASAERVVGGCVRACLVAPLAEAAVHGKREACLAASGAWMAYMASLPRHLQGHDATSDLLEVATLIITAVSEAGRLAAEARSGAGADVGELGSGLAGNELPPLQACAIYVLRRGVMASLAEAGQRKLLERLSSLLDKRLTTPAAVVTLEALATLLEAVGEVTDETAASLELLMQPYVTSNSAATRQQAAIALAALAAAHPAAAARMLSGCLETLASCAAQMAAPLSAAAAPAAGAASGVSSTAGSLRPEGLQTVGPATTTGQQPSRSASGASVDGPAAGGPASALTPAPQPGTPNSAAAAAGRHVPGQRALMDACHGAALAAARLLLTTARAPLGCPARLQRRALVLAEDLVTGPGPELAGNRAICREVGYLLLGALCTLGVPQAIRGPEEMAALWQVALGEAARKDLDERSLFRPGGELDLAVQLWWRSVALQALSAYVAAVQLGVGFAATGLGASSRTATPGAGGPPRSRSYSALAAAASGGSFSVAASFSFAAAHAAEPSASGLSRLRSGSGSVPSMNAAAAGGSGASEGGAGWLVVDAWGDNPVEAALTALAPLLQPLLELLDTQTYLVDPAKAKGGPGGILAGAAAMFTMCLLELHLRVPAGRIVPSPAHVALLAKACLRPFRHGLTAAAADSLTVTALRPLLSADDAPLGPWAPGSDPLEDALHTYTGSRGAPHLPPWLTPEEYSVLITSGVAPASAAAAVPGAASASVLMGVGGLAGTADVSSNAVAALPTGLGYGMDPQGHPAAPVTGGMTDPALVAAGLGGGAGGGGVSLGGLTHAAFPQPVGLEAALLTAQLVLLGRLMAVSPVQQQLQMLEVILTAVQAARTTARQSRDAAACRRPPVGVAAAISALAAYGTGAMAGRRSRAPMDASDRVPDKLLQLAQALLPDEYGTTAVGASPASATAAAAPLSRAAAELFAASAAAGNDAWALRVIRALALELRDSPGGSATNGAASAAPPAAPLTPHQQQQRAVVAVALGAAHRCRGGLAMQGAVAGSVDALVAAASRPGGAAAAAWILHGLWLVAGSGGGAFVPRVRTSLQLAEELLVSSYESAALRAACARLANASVAVLGPEFSLGSWAYERAKSLVIASGGALAASASAAGADAAAGAAVVRRGSGAGLESGADGGLGMVLFVQQIILFAPHAVPPAKHVPLLLSRLLSRQPDLRAAAALTLRHLAERSADALRPAEAAPPLFAALDGESDGRIAGQLRATLITILVASVPSAPSFWLELLSDVVFAVGQPTATAAPPTGGAGDAANGGRGHEDDDDGEKYGNGRTGAAASAGSPTSSPAGKGAASASAGGRGLARSAREVLAAPHLRTRHFAADCLLRMVRICVASDERHRDSTAVEWMGGAATGGAKGRRSTGGGNPHGDLLIAKLQVLVDVGFKLATCPLESLRPYGVRLLTLLVQLFGDVPDSLLPGARLMEQYQAQVVSALRSSLGARQVAPGGLPGFGAGTAGAGGLAAVSVSSLASSQHGAPVPGSASSSVAAAVAAASAMVQHPLLQIAGGTLATVFLESGLAAGDAVVMRRLMELLCAPLAAWSTLRYQNYSEWVGARARIELLRAHAQCASIAALAAARGDALCAGIVAKAHEPHAALLRSMWTTLLQDHAVLSSQPESVLILYGSPLLDGGSSNAADTAVGTGSVAAAKPVEAEANGDSADTAGNGVTEATVADAAADDVRGSGLTPALATVLRPVYGAACPAVLTALAGALPPPAELVADAIACGQFRRLMEVALLLLTDASARLAAAIQDVIARAAADPAATAAAASIGTGAPSLVLHAGGSGGCGGNKNISQASATQGYTDVCLAASRLAAVLRALQRLVSAGYLAAIVSQPDSPAGASGPDGIAGTGSPSAAASGPSEPRPASEEFLLPPAVLRDMLGALGAVAAHALLPLHQALLGGALPASLTGLLPPVVLPCCTLVREVCASAPEAALGPDSPALAPAVAAVAGIGAEESGVSSGLPSSPLAGGSDDEGTGPRPVPNGCASPTLANGPAADHDRDAHAACGSRGDAPPDTDSDVDTARPGSSPRPTVIAEAAEALLCLASVCVPYCYGSSYHVRHGAEAAAEQNGPSGLSQDEQPAAVAGVVSAAGWAPRWLLPAHSELAGRGSRGGRGSDDGGAVDASRPEVPGCSPVLGPLAPEHAAGLVSCAVQVLAAAQLLLRRAPWSTLEPHVGPLLELPLRIIMTAAPGEPVVTAAQRYLDAATAALLARAAAAGPGASSPAAKGACTASPSSDAAPEGSMAGASGPASPSAYAAAAVVALANAADLHLRALRQEQHSDGVDGGIAAPSRSLLLGRFAALVSPLLGCGAGMDSVVEPLFSPPAAAQGTHAQGASGRPAGPGSGPVALVHVGSRAAHFGGATGSVGQSSAGVLGQHRAHRISGSSSRSNSGTGAGSVLAPIASPKRHPHHQHQHHQPHHHHHQPHLVQQLQQQQQQQRQQHLQHQGGAPAAQAAAPSPAVARACALAVLSTAVLSDVPSAAALAVLEAARGSVQDAAGDDPGSARGRWARVVLCTIVPAAMERVGPVLVGAQQPLSGPEQSVVAECLKLLVLAATLAAPQGGPAQEGVMQVLVPLLVELAAPAAGPAAVTPPLRDMAIKLITSLPAAAAGAAFKVHLAAQPQAAKLRLQGALRDAATASAPAAAAAAPGAAVTVVAAPFAASATGVAATGFPVPGAGAGAGGGASGSGARRPAIQLKTTFALPLPNGK